MTPLQSLLPNSSSSPDESADSLAGTVCDLCGASRLYYRDTTNHVCYCKACHAGDRIMSKVEPADLFASYEAALAASEVALVQAKQIEPTVIGVSSITTPDQAAWAGQAGQAIAKTRRRLEDQRDAAAKPLFAAYKAARDGFKPALDLLGHLESTLKNGLREYAGAQAIAQAAALKAIAPAAAPAEIARTIEATSSEVENVSLRQHWIARGADGGALPTTPMEAAQRGLAIPAEYWVLDAARLHKLAREQKDALSIVGVQAFDEKSVVFS
jgi:hypothetical protein